MYTVLYTLYTWKTNENDSLITPSMKIKIKWEKLVINWGEFERYFTIMNIYKSIRNIETQLLVCKQMWYKLFLRLINENWNHYIPNRNYVLL